MKPNHVMRADNMDDAKYTVITRCLSLAKAALESRWTFHNSTEALFWFSSALKVDPKNATARLGSARVYQYVASQPWWQNYVSLAKSAASKALAMLDELVGTDSCCRVERESTCTRPDLFSNWPVKCRKKVFK